MWGRQTRMLGVFNAVRRCLRFWLESLGQGPGLTRDVALPVATRSPSSALGQCLPATWTAQPGMSDAERKLADEMVWGWSLDFSSAPLHIRVSM